MAKIKMPRSFGWYALKELERFDLTKINEFRFHVARSIEQSSQPLTMNELEANVEDFESDFDHNAYLSHLNDQQYELGEIERLSDELSIIALNKRAETATNGILDAYLPELSKNNRHIINVLDSIVPFDLKQITEYAARDELRLLNNAIKHEDGVVSSSLSKSYPHQG